MTDNNESKAAAPGKLKLPKAIWVPDALSEAEWLAMQLISTVHELMVDKIIGNGPARWGDVSEVTSAVHVIQHMIQSQAAARVYPDAFRLLGEGATQEEEDEYPEEDVSPGA